MNSKDHVELSQENTLKEHNEVNEVGIAEEPVKEQALPTIIVQQPSPKAEEPEENPDDIREDSIEVTSVKSEALSLSELINMDNISAFNLYLGPEIQKASNCSLDQLNSSDEEDGGLDEVSSTASSRLTASPAKSEQPVNAVEIDYSSLDRFGFIVLSEDEKYPPGSEEEAKIRKQQTKKNLREANRATKWIDMLKTLEGSDESVKGWPDVHRKFEERLEKGIPDCLRSKVWNIFAKGTSVEPANPRQAFRELYMKVSGFERQIDLDIERTLRDHVLFKIRFSSAQVSLFKILVAYSNLDPAVGYCQGMSTVGAFMLLYFEEEVAFNVFVNVLQRARLRNLYMVGFNLLFETFFVHEQLVQKFLPIVHNRLNSLHITTSIYATKWYLTLFLGFQFQLATRIWDLFLYYGFDILIAASIALLKMHEDRIIRLDYERCMEFLSRLSDTQINDDELVELTMSIWNRLVPSMSTYWAEQEEATRLDLGESIDTPLKVTRKSSVFFKLRKAYALMQEKELSEKLNRNKESK